MIADGVITVRVGYMRGYGGGIRRVLGEGLPVLSARADLDVEYADLFASDADMDDMERRGVRVNREVGVNGPSLLSVRRGWARRAELVGALPRLWRIAWRFRAWANGVHVVYVHSYRDLLAALAFRSLTRRSRRPVIVWHCHGMGPHTPLAFRQVTRVPSAVIAVSRSVGDRLSQANVGCRTVVIHNAVDAPGLGASASSADLSARKHDGRFLLMVACAALRPDKGVHVVIRALGSLPDEVALWVTGDTKDPAAQAYIELLQEAAARLGVQDRITYLGQVEDVWGCMAAADVVVVPSLVHEAFGLVAAEAMALGKPVIASGRGGLLEVVGHDSPLLFDPDNPGQLVEAVLRLRSESDLYEREAARGQRRVAERFSYERWADQVATVFREAVRP